MLPFKCMTPSGDKRHYAAIKAFSDFQRPVARSVGSRSQHPLLQQGGRELLAYLRTGLWVRIVDRLEEAVQALESGPTINKQHQ